jgi:hypothetical protein
MRGKAVMRRHLGDEEVAVLELDERADTAELQDELARLTVRRRDRTRALLCTANSRSGFAAGWCPSFASAGSLTVVLAPFWEGSLVPCPDTLTALVAITTRLCRLAAPQGGRTVPRIFVDGRFIGGADDVSALDASGELERMLREAGLLGGATE